MDMSQLRKHLKKKIGHHIRARVQKSRLGLLGSNVFIEKSVQLLRYPKNIYIGNNVVLKEGSKICSCNENAMIHIGDNTTIGYNTFIFASESIKIGSNCLIAPFVYIVDSDHQINKESRINSQPNQTGPIYVGEDVWIASNCTILRGVKIGRGAVIAANSVVNCDVPEYHIYGGTPARKIGERQ